MMNIDSKLKFEMMNIGWKKLKIALLSLGLELEF